MTDEHNTPDDSPATNVTADQPDPREFVGVAAKPMSQPQQGDFETPDVTPTNLEGVPQHAQFTGDAATQSGFADLANMAAALGDRDVTHYSARQMRRARDVLTRMYAVRRSVRFYPLDHPAVAEGVSLLMGALRGFFEEGVDVYLTFYDGEVLLGEQLLTEESVLFDQLVRDMTGIGVGTLTLRRGIAEEELARAMAILAVDANTADQAGGVERMANEAELPHVRIGAVVAVERAGKTEGEPIEAASAAFGSAVSLMREIDRLLRMNRHVSSAKVKGVVRSLVDNVLTNRYAMLQLTGLKNYDEYTFYHSANVAILSLALGSTVTTDYRFLSSLGVGALLHDIGKLTVDLRILNKPGALTPEEWADVRQHPVGGAEMTALLPGVDKSAVGGDDSRTPHAMGRRRLPVAHPPPQAAPRESYRGRRGLLRCDDVAAQLLRRAGPGRRDGTSRAECGDFAGPHARQALHPDDGALSASFSGPALRRRGCDRARPR